MASDPFAEFQQVSEATEISVDPTVVSILGADPTQDALDKQRATDLFAAEASLYPPEFQETARAHFISRMKYAERVNRKIDEINDVTNRLYRVRHSTTTDAHDVLTQTKELLGRLNCLNEELSQLREKQMMKFSSQLLLDDIGLSRRISTKSFRTGTTVQVSRKATSDSLNVGSSAIPRTKSSNAVSGASAVAKDDKWTFRPFRDNRSSSSAASQLVKPSKDVTLLIQDEIAQLRAGIYKLNQKKKLSDLDQSNLAFLQTKLKALTDLV